MNNQEPISDNARNDDEKIKKIHSALQVNQTLIEQFELRRQKILQQLQDLDFQQEDLDENRSVATTSSTSIYYKKISHLEKRYSAILLSKFYKPYLNDDRGFSAPNLFNPEHEYVIENHIQLLLHHPSPVRDWTANEKKIIRNEVRSQHTYHQTRQILNRIEELSSLSRRTNEQSEEIKKLNSEIAMKRLSNEEPERFAPYIEWLSIAKSFVNYDDRSDDDCELYYNNYLHSSINRHEWTNDEDEKLQELIDKYGENDWDKIAGELNTNRLPWQCCQRYQMKFSKSMHILGPIDKKESTKLLRLIKSASNEAGEVNWKYISHVEEGRQLQQIKYFYSQHILSSLALKKYKRWTRLEDTIFFAAKKYYQHTEKSHNKNVTDNDDKNKNLNLFSKIAKHLPGRTNRQIRERYAMILSKQRQKRGFWKPSEDLRLLKHCIKHLNLYGKIDYVRLNRESFRLRNAHQLHHRFRLLNRYLPENFFNQDLKSRKQIDKKLSEINLEQIKTRRFVIRKILRPKLPSDRTKLFNYLRKLSNIQQMIIDGKLIEYNFEDEKNDEDFVSDDSEDDNFDDEEEEIKDEFDEEDYSDENDENNANDVEIEMQKQQTDISNGIPKISSKIIRKKLSDPIEDHQSTIDSCINLYKYLKPLSKYFHQQCVYSTKSDVFFVNLVRTVLHELLDLDINKNLNTLTKELNENDQETMNNNNYNDNLSVSNINQCKLDIIRLYLSSTTVAINHQKIKTKSSIIRSLFLPNYSTTYAFMLMQFLHNFLFIYSIDNQFKIEDETMDDDNDDDYKKLRTMFISLFLWPALLTRLRPDNNITDKNLQQKLLSNLPSTQNANDEEEVVKCNGNQQTTEETAITSEPRRGRKAKLIKKSNHENLDEFFRLRSLQHWMFNYKDLNDDDEDDENESQQQTSSSTILWFEQSNFQTLLAKNVLNYMEKVLRKTDNTFTRGKPHKISLKKNYMNYPRIKPTDYDKIDDNDSDDQNADMNSIDCSGSTIRRSKRIPFRKRKISSDYISF